MDFSGIELLILRGVTTVLLSIAILQLLVHELRRLWSSVRRNRDIVVETNRGPVKVSVDPENEASIRELLDVISKAESVKQGGPNGEPK